jgi:hypothetical protein
VRDKVPSSNACVRAAQLNRYGARAVAVITLVGCTSSASDVRAAEIAVRKLESNAYELTLTNQTPLDEREARAHIANAAQSICKGLEPVLGKYRFESKQPLGGGTLSREPATYVFVQDVTCGSATKAQVAKRAPTLRSSQDAQRVHNDIKSRSEAYFRLLAEKQFDDAYSQMNESALGLDRAKWTRDQQAFQSLAGDLRSIGIVRITVYDNPVEAPEPGLYVAADFSNAYVKVPFQCGYLMWFRPEGGDFEITRTEIGHVTAEQLKTIPEVQVPDLKRKLRCIAP